MNQSAENTDQYREQRKGTVADASFAEPDRGHAGRLKASQREGAPTPR